MDNEERKQASKMHMSFFDKSRLAIEEGYYLEAVMYEYAAIEGRLEVICGLLGCPCNKELDSSIRKGINIGNRIDCLKKLYRRHPACKDCNTNLDSGFWKRLKQWTKSRNIYVHGLYKNPSAYISRLEEREALAKEGLDLARLLYNDAKRIRRIVSAHPEKMEYAEPRCKKGQCF